MSTTEAADPCPSCGSTDTVDIVYGEPDSERLQAWERGDAELGDFVTGDDPTSKCRACGKEFRGRRPS